MRLIAKSTLVTFWSAHPKAKPPLMRWLKLVVAADWSSMNDVQSAISNVVILNAERARFEVAGGNYRLVAAFDFPRKIVFVKFLGTHREYDKIDALTVSSY